MNDFLINLPIILVGVGILIGGFLIIDDERHQASKAKSKINLDKKTKKRKQI